MRRVAVVGSGISGLAAAHALAGEARVTLFEAGDYFGGHPHTVGVTLPATLVVGILPNLVADLAEHATFAFSLGE